MLVSRDRLFDYLLELRLVSMKFWSASFLILLGIAELYQWVKDFTLPLPIYIFGGAFLAIASNYEKGIAFLKPSQSTAINPQLNSQEAQALPPAQIFPQPPKSISFKIKED